ncbi:MAG: TRZ/ATZ family hydrolase [Gammaproteobacteria bacterium]|nr:TRZ/ATZ family hydrolase [Gammaproteobacteria bacterium]HJO11816.1 TRZ/ATZ family hydrolase [Gammaproteobacteria bacterium]
MSPDYTLQADLVIHAKWVIPVDTENRVLENYSVVVANKRITNILSQDEARKKVSAAQVVELPHHVLLPGLINAHGHAAMSLFRGVSNDIPLQQWLEEHIWPLEGKHVTPEFVQHGAMLACAEMIVSGTTCFADMYFFPDAVAKVALDAQLRVQLASPILDFPTVWANDADEYILKATQLHDSYRNSELICTAFGPHATYTVSDAALQKVSILAEELDIPIHMHVHETAQEVKESVIAKGKRPLQRLAELGLVSPHLLCVHATQLIEEELQLLNEYGAHVIHCPESNLKLASGFCPVSKLLESDINVGIGTDGCASNNDLDMFSEMRTTALLAKAVAADASAVPAYQALRMATINGARAMGLDDRIGSIELGKFADLTAVNMDSINSIPIYDPVSHLVYNTQASQVSHVWCSGKALFENGQLLTIDKLKLYEVTHNWQKQIAN